MMNEIMFYMAFIDERIKHKGTFSTKEFSQIPKFVQNKMADKAELNRIKKKLAWRREDIPLL